MALGPLCTSAGRPAAKANSGDSVRSQVQSAVKPNLDSFKIAADVQGYGLLQLKPKTRASRDEIPSPSKSRRGSQCRPNYVCVIESPIECSNFQQPSSRKHRDFWPIEHHPTALQMLSFSLAPVFIISCGSLPSAPHLIECISSLRRTSEAASWCRTCRPRL